MRTVQLPDEILAGLEAVATLEGSTVTELVGGAVVDLLAERYHAIQAAYVALREIDPDNGKPAGSTRKKASRRTKPDKVCVRDGCDRKGQSRGMCSTHYKRWYDGRDPIAPDGTRSPCCPDDDVDPEGDVGVLAGDSEPVTKPEVDGPPVVATTQCLADRCPSPARDDDSEFCDTHDSVAARLTRRLGAEFGDGAREEAVDRLMAGRR